MSYQFYMWIPDVGEIVSPEYICLKKCQQDYAHEMWLKRGLDARTLSGVPYLKDGKKMRMRDLFRDSEVCCDGKHYREFFEEIEKKKR